jgi:hypothetical protein
VAYGMAQHPRTQALMLRANGEHVFLEAGLQDKARCLQPEVDAKIVASSAQSSQNSPTFSARSL